MGRVSRAIWRAALVVGLGACSENPDSTPDVSGEECESGMLVDDGGRCVPERCGTALTPVADVVVGEGESVQSAADALVSGTLGLGAGTWRETLTLGGNAESLSIVGRCPELTLLDGSGGADRSGVVTILGRAGGEVSLRGMTITSGKKWGVSGRAAAINLTDLDLFANSSEGMFLYGSAPVTLTNVVVRDTASDDQHTLGTGIQISDSASVSGSNVSISNSQGVGLNIFGASFDVDGFSVGGTNKNRSGGGYGVNVTDGTLTLADAKIEGSEDLGLFVYGLSTVDIRGGQILENAGAGIVVEDPTAHVHLTDSEVSRNGRGGGKSDGNGISADGGATVVLDNVTMEANAAAGIIADGDGTTVEMNGGSIVRTSAVDWLDSGGGLTAQRGASAVIRGATFTENISAAILAKGEGSVAEVADTRVVDTLPRADGEKGSALVADTGGRIVASRLLISGSHEAGVVAVDGSSLVLEDSIVEGTVASSLPGSGMGVQSNAGASVTLRRVVLSGNRGVGADVLGPASTLTLEDVTASDSVFSDEAGFGGGFYVAGGARLEGRNVAVFRSVGLAVAATGVGTKLVLDGLTIRDVGARADGLGSALAVTGGASAEVSDLVMMDVSPIGILADEVGTNADFRGARLSGVTPSPFYSTAIAAASQRGASLAIDDAQFADVRGPAMRATEDGFIACTQCSVVGSQFAGVVVDGGDVALTDSEVLDSTADPTFGGGVGVFVGNHAGPGGVSLTRNLLSGHPLAGVWVEGENTVDIADSVLVGSAGVAVRDGLNVHGNAIFARGLGSLHVRSSEVKDSVDVGVLLEASTGTFTEMVWRNNGVDLAQQSCGELSLPDLDQGASVELCLPDERLTLTLAFDVALVESVVETE